MAAEFLLTFALEDTLTRVSSIAAEGIRFAWGLEGQLQKLKQSLTMIQAVLQDAARRPVTDESVKLWLEKLQDVAYDAEDVLDEFAYEILRKDQKKGKVRDCFSLHNPVAFRLNMGQKVKKINGALDEIQKLTIGLGITSPQHVDRAPEISLDRETDSSLERSEVVVGRDDDVSKVMKLLIGSIDQQLLSVVPILGMAGVGKTTIAKKVCEVVRERKHFDVTLWVCVSNDFSKRRILGEMLQKIDKSTGGLSNLDAILENLQKELEKKTFLLVLDDVWNEDHDKWDDFDDPNLVPAEVSFLTRLQTLPLFDVGPGHKIEELGCLNELRGELEISKLEQVRDKEEAEKAKLREKRMNKLVFQWSDGGNSSVNYEDVLEGLQPHPNIRSLTIEDYGGENFPSWVSILPLNNLTVLRLNGCINCRQLPTLGRLPRLEILHISGVRTVKCIGNEFYGSNGSASVVFPALKEFTLFRMNGLEEWTVPGGEGDQVFPRLEKLTIEWCRKLKSIPICGLSSLVEFKIEGCDELRYLSGEFHGFTSLQLLWIWTCGKMASIPSVQHCTALVKLDIRWCPELISIPGLRQFTSLVDLTITGCRSLSHFPEDCLGSFTQLQRLSIGGYSEEHLSGSLEYLWIYGWDKLKSVPHQLQHLTALKTLWIVDFKGEEFEEALPDWLANLSSLQRLWIDNCKKVKYVASSTARQRLSKLKEFWIWRCSLLEENCRKDNGSEWPNISHIPSIYINCVRVQG